MEIWTKSNDHDQTGQLNEPLPSPQNAEVEIFKTLSSRDPKYRRRGHSLENLRDPEGSTFNSTGDSCNIFDGIKKDNSCDVVDVGTSPLKYPMKSKSVTHSKNVPHGVVCPKTNVPDFDETAKHISYKDISFERQLSLNDSGICEKSDDISENSAVGDSQAESFHMGDNQSAKFSCSDSKFSDSHKIKVHSVIPSCQFVSVVGQFGPAEVAKVQKNKAEVNEISCARKSPSLIVRHSLKPFSLKDSQTKFINDVIESCKPTISTSPSEFRSSSLSQSGQHRDPRDVSGLHEVDASMGRAIDGDDGSSGSEVAGSEKETFDGKDLVVDKTLIEDLKENRKPEVVSDNLNQEDGDSIVIIDNIVSEATSNEAQCENDEEFMIDATNLGGKSWDGLVKGCNTWHGITRTKRKQRSSVLGHFDASDDDVSQTKHYPTFPLHSPKSPSLLDAMHRKYCHKPWGKCEIAASKHDRLVDLQMDAFVASLEKVPKMQHSPKKDVKNITDSVKCTTSYETVSSVKKSTEDQSIQLQSGNHKSNEFTEVEATEACRWLLATGFPQYLQMYQDGLFPIDLNDLSVENKYLDKDSLSALTRRLETLNRSSELKISLSAQKINDESDDGDTRALNDDWQYEWRNSRWVKTDQSRTLSDSFDSATSELNSEQSPVLKKKSTKNNDKEAFSPRLRRAASLRVKSAKNFLRRVDILNRSQRRKHNVYDIGSPVVVNPGDMDARLAHLNCRAIKTSSDAEKMNISVDTSQSPNDVEPWSDSDMSPTNQSPVLSSPVLSSPVTSSYVSDCDQILSTAGYTAMKNRQSRSINRERQSNGDGDANVISSDHIPGSFPKVLSNGYIETSDGFGINYRTGSFNFGLDSIHSSPKDARLRFASNRRSSLNASTNRRSVYDNVPDGTSDDHNDNGSEMKLNAVSPSVSPETASNQTSPIFVDQNADVLQTSLTPQEQLDLVLSQLFDNIECLDQVLRDFKETANTSPCDGDSSSDATSDRSMKQTTRESWDADDSSGVRDHTSPGDTLAHLTLSDLNSNVDFSTSRSTTFDDDNVSNANVSPSGVITRRSDVAVLDNLQNGYNDNRLLRSVSQGDTPSGDARRSNLVTNHVTDSSVQNHHGVNLQHGWLSSDERNKGNDRSNCDNEKRDSGVGLSTERNANDVGQTISSRVRWHSFQRSHRPSLAGHNLHMDSLSVGQLLLLRKLSLLKLTAIMEKFSAPNRSGWNWLLPRFMKRTKAPEYDRRNVFGVPLLVTLQRTSQPLPQCILAFMRYLHHSARDCVGLFRKSGVRSRIQRLRASVEANPSLVNLESLGEDIQPYDVADLLKQYFRELPECLLTVKLSQTFINIISDVPTTHRLDALQAAILLLPDENREVLQSLVLFLSDIAKDASSHQMNCSNLAVCFAPSLFHANSIKVSTPTPSPKRPHKNLGLPDVRELVEQKAAHECLSLMISECNALFKVSEDTIAKCRFSYMEQGDPMTLEEFTNTNRRNEPSYLAYVDSCIQGLIKESHDKVKGWISALNVNGVEVAYRKVSDGHPLRLWRCSVEVDAVPADVLHRVLHERHLWDEDITKRQYVEKLRRHTDVFHYTRTSMAPHPGREYCLLRSWTTDLPNGACVVVATSVDHPDAEMSGGIRAVVLASRYLIEPCGSPQRSKVTHIIRVDTRGRSQEWYNRAYGHIAANLMRSLRASFKLHPVTGAGDRTSNTIADISQ